MAPDDFIALHLNLVLRRRRGHQSPGFDRAWRAVVLERWAENTDVPLRDGGVYWQAIGPRFETQAEIRLLAAHADLVGMTIASECVLAGELRIAYAAVCVVDNLANGVGDTAHAGGVPRRRGCQPEPAGRRARRRPSRAGQDDLTS